MYARAAASAERVFGPEHRATLTLRSNEAVALEAIGELDEAERIAREVLETQRRAFGDAHDDTLSSASNLGNMLVRTGHHDEAEAILREALSTLIAARGDDSLLAGMLYGGLGKSLRGLERYDEAETAFLRSLEIIVAAVGPGHPAARATLGEIRSFYGPEGMNNPERLAEIEASVHPPEGADGLSD